MFYCEREGNPFVHYLDKIYHFNIVKVFLNAHCTITKCNQNKKIVSFPRTIISVTLQCIIADKSKTLFFQDYWKR